MISICIIVKNDSGNFKKCLEKLLPLNYEIVVVDTGSTDETKEVAFRHTENVYDFEWCDDFSAARNFATSKSSNDHILFVDSDEFLMDFDKKELERLVCENPEKVGRIHRNNEFTREGKKYKSRELVNRLFSKNLYYYSGEIHEQVTAFSGEGYTTYPAPLYFQHMGYEGSEEQRKAKAERNIELLKKVLEKKGDDPYILYQMGKAYYLEGNHKEASLYFSKALEFDLDINLEYVIDMVEMYGYSLLNSDRVEEALFFENIYNEFSGSADFVFLMGLIYMQNLKFDKAESEFLKAATYKDAKVEGVNSYMAMYNAGVIRECLGDKEKAREYFKKCGEYGPALEGMKRCD